MVASNPDAAAWRKYKELMGETAGAAEANIEAEKRKRIEEAQYRRDDSRRSIYNGYRLWTILLAPLPALLIGVWMLVRRRARAAAIVP